MSKSGTTARVPRPVTRRMSLELRMVRSQVSRKKARPTPRSSEVAKLSPMAKGGSGLAGFRGGMAGSAMLMFDDSEPPETAWATSATATSPSRP